MSDAPISPGEKSRGGRVVVFGLYFLVLGFLAVCFFRAIVAQLFFGELPLSDGQVRGLSVADKVVCLERAAVLQRSLSSAVLIEIDSPYQGGSPDERWNNAQLDWNREFSTAYKSCIVAGDERVRGLFTHLAAEQQGYQRLLEFYISKVRTYAVQRAEAQNDLAAEISRQRH
jgi:hypothetical protein